MTSGAKRRFTWFRSAWLPLSDWSVAKWCSVLLLLGLVFFAGMWAEYKLLSTLNLVSSEATPSTLVRRTLSPNAGDTAAFADAIVDETNKVRSAAGLAPLTRISKLDASAGAKLDHLMRHDYWSHYSPDGVSPWAFMTLSGYEYADRMAAENLAQDFATPEEVVQGWMDSPSHRDIMLTSGYTDIGVAALYREGAILGPDRGWIVVAHHALPR